MGMRSIAGLYKDGQGGASLDIASQEAPSPRQHPTDIGCSRGGHQRQRRENKDVDVKLRPNIAKSLQHATYTCLKGKLI